MTIRYAVHLTLPAVDLAFEVDEQGDGFVEAMTGVSLAQAPPLRLGRFAVHLGPAVPEALARLAEARDDQQQAYDTPTRFVGSGPADLVPVSPPAEVIEPLEAELAQAALEGLGEPLCAVRVGTSDGVSLTVESIGTEPFPAVFHEPEAFRVQIWRDDPDDPSGRSSLAPEGVDALVEKGVLATGPVALAPGSVVALPLPPGAGHGGGFTFWHAPGGPQRRMVTGTWFHAG